MLDDGYNAYQIALIHNGGQAVEKRGVNKYGQKYDTAAYASKVLAYIQS